jgi:dihydrolipoamide dehydrogenase
VEEREIVVIGGGPGGYVAAIRAAQLGGKVTLIEKDTLGGTCLNRGCIPSKALLHSVEVLQSVKEAGQYGIDVPSVSVDLARMMARKNRVVAQLVSGVGGLLSANKVEVIKGTARLKAGKQIEVTDAQGQKRTLQAQKIIIATGARAIKLPIPGADSPTGIIPAENILNISAIPRSLLMIGGGVVGLEMTTILTRLGGKVTVVEMLPHVLPAEDEELTNIITKSLQDDGVAVYTGAKVTKIEDAPIRQAQDKPGGKLVTVVTKDGEKKIEAELVAIAVGYRPNTADLGLEEAGIAAVKGAIQANQRMETNVPGIYAVGDCIGKIMLAYVAMTEGEVAAENAMGKDACMDYDVVPRCVYLMPELAAVGLTEADAVNSGYQVKVGKFPFAANGMATILGERRGMVKIVTDAKTGQILGVHIVGPRATDLIAEATLAMKLELTAEELIATIHSHPSLCEAVREAALDVTGEMIHFISRKK